jgi:hypothetical protein
VVDRIGDVRMAWSEQMGPAAGPNVPDQRSGAGAQDAADLGQAGRWVGPVVHRQGADDQVEGSVGERQRGHVADQKLWPALVAGLAVPAADSPALLTLDQAAGELLLAFERDLEARLAAASGDLAHLAGWAAKLAGATCRLAGLLHLAGHLRSGWAQPIGADTFAGAARLAGYLVDHARAVFDLMGADPRLDDAR